MEFLIKIDENIYYCHIILAHKKSPVFTDRALKNDIETFANFKNLIL